MSLSTLSIKRPVFTIVVNLTIILFGIIGYSYLGVREFPSIDPAQISVRTNYTGANADIIESQITEPLEKAINSIDGIRNITSSSNQGSSNITIEFKLEKNQPLCLTTHASNNSPPSSTKPKSRARKSSTFPSAIPA